jgi:hypothetical protein
MAGEVATLQNTINRYAVVGGFARVAVDGFWGEQTRQGVRNALGFVGQARCYKLACPDDETARAALDVIARWDEGASAVPGLVEFLGGVADDLGLPLVAAPISSSAPSPIVPHVMYQASLVQRLKMLPLWQQITLGVATSLGLIFLVNYLSAPKMRRAKRAA